MNDASALEVDREDLLGLLTMRFGNPTQAVEDKINSIEDVSTLERLILVAANVSTWKGFLEELQGGPESFRIVGSMYDPLASADRGDNRDDQ